VLVYPPLEGVVERKHTKHEPRQWQQQVNQNAEYLLRPHVCKRRYRFLTSKTGQSRYFLVERALKFLMLQANEADAHERKTSMELRLKRRRKDALDQLGN